MSDENIWPDEVIESVNWAISDAEILDRLADPVDPRDTVDADPWVEADDLDSDVTLTVGHPDPSAPLDGEQTFVIRVRSSDNEAGDPASATFEVREGSNVVETFESETTVTQDQDGETWIGTFDASAISDASEVEMRLFGDSTGGMPGTRDTVEIGAFRWEAQVGVAEQSASLTTSDADMTAVSGTRQTTATVTTRDSDAGAPSGNRERTAQLTTADGDKSAFSAVVPPIPTDGLQNWLSADQLSLNDSDPVATWPDESGNNHDAEQTDSNLQPTYRSLAFPSGPGVEFDADYLVVDADDIDTGVHTVFLLFRTAMGGTDDTIGVIAGKNDGSDIRDWWFAIDNGFGFTGVDGSIGYRIATDEESGGWTNLESGADHRDNTPYIAMGQNDPNNVRDGNLTLEIDATTVDSNTSDDPANGANQPVYIGTERGLEAERQFDGEIAELIVYNRVLSDTEISTVNSYLSDTYLADDVEQSASVSTQDADATAISATRASAGTLSTRDSDSSSIAGARARAGALTAADADGAGTTGQRLATGDVITQDADETTTTGVTDGTDQWFWTAEDYSVDETPEEWTDITGDAVTLDIQNDDDGNYLAYDGGYEQRSGLRFDPPGEDYDTEIYAVAKLPPLDSTDPEHDYWFGSRWSHDTDPDNWDWVRADHRDRSGGNEHRLTEYVDGDDSNLGAIASDFGSDDLYAVRMTFDDDTAKLRVWDPDAETEPSTWDISEDVTPTDAGTQGIGHWLMDDGPVHIYEFGVGIDGQAAPTSPVTEATASLVTQDADETTTTGTRQTAGAIGTQDSDRVAIAPTRAQTATVETLDADAIAVAGSRGRTSTVITADADVTALAGVRGRTTAMSTLDADVASTAGVRAVSGTTTTQDGDTGLIAGTRATSATTATRDADAVSTVGERAVNATTTTQDADRSAFVGTGPAGVTASLVTRDADASTAIGTRAAVSSTATQDADVATVAGRRATMAAILVQDADWSAFAGTGPTVITASMRTQDADAVAVAGTRGIWSEPVTQDVDAVSMAGTRGIGAVTTTPDGDTAVVVGSRGALGDTQTFDADWAAFEGDSPQLVELIERLPTGTGEWRVTLPTAEGTFVIEFAEATGEWRVTFETGTGELRG